MMEGLVLTPDSQEAAAPLEGIPAPDLTQQDAAPTQPAAEEAAPEDVNTKRIADTESALKETQRALHEARGELKQLTEMQKAVLQPQPEAPQDYLATGNWQEKFVDDPGTAFAEAIKNERAQNARAYVQALEEFSGELKSEFKAMLADATNPDRQSLSGELERIGSEVEGFSQLPVEQQVKLAKMMKSQEQTLTPPGSPAGTGVAQQSARGTDDYQKRVAALTARMFPGTMAEGQEGFPDITGIGSMHKANGA